MFKKLCNSLLRKSQHVFRREIVTKIPSREFKEIEVQVPWGKLSGKNPSTVPLSSPDDDEPANNPENSIKYVDKRPDPCPGIGKYYGSANVEPILGLHGWQDNANSFDPLVDYLPENMSFLSIDFPGHGYSSWIPKGLMYNTLIYIQTVERVREYFGLNKIALVGHSMGGMISFNYTSLFPDNVKFVVAFDYYKYPSISVDKYLPYFVKEWKDFFKYEKLATPVPSYSENEAIQRWIEASKGSIDEKLCRILIKRGTVMNPDGTVYFKRDPRVKLFLMDIGYTHEYLTMLAKRIQCPYMILKGENSKHNESKKHYYDIIKVLEVQSKDFQFKTIPGTHHFHMINPHLVAEAMIPFLNLYNN